VMTGLGYHIIRNIRNDLSIRTSALFRYQSSSDDGVGIYYEPATGLPFPVVVFDHRDPQKTFATGLSLQLGYNYFTLKNYTIGIFGAFQLDTNGDVIRNAGISLGKRF
jgi:hypothetical protein